MRHSGGIQHVAVADVQWEDRRPDVETGLLADLADCGVEVALAGVRRAGDRLPKTAAVLVATQHREPVRRRHTPEHNQAVLRRPRDVSVDRSVVAAPGEARRSGSIRRPRTEILYALSQDRVDERTACYRELRGKPAPARLPAAAYVLMWDQTTCRGGRPDTVRPRRAAVSRRPVRDIRSRDRFHRPGVRRRARRCRPHSGGDDAMDGAEDVPELRGDPARSTGAVGRARLPAAVPDQTADRSGRCDPCQPSGHTRIELSRHNRGSDSRRRFAIHRLANRRSHASAVASWAPFVVLGGTSYAALTLAPWVHCAAFPGPTGAARSPTSSGAPDGESPSRR
jgi:hypothetical protein